APGKQDYPRIGQTREGLVIVNFCTASVVVTTSHHRPVKVAIAHKLDVGVGGIDGRIGRAATGNHYPLIGRGKARENLKITGLRIDICGVDDAIARKAAISGDIELYLAGHGQGAVASQTHAMKTVRPSSKRDGVVTRPSQVTTRRVISSS